MGLSMLNSRPAASKMRWRLASMSAPSSADWVASTAGSTCMPVRSMRASTPTSGISMSAMSEAESSFSRASASTGTSRRAAWAVTAAMGSPSAGAGSSPVR